MLELDNESWQNLSLIDLEEFGCNIPDLETW